MAICFITLGCSPVPVWERHILAKPQMALTPFPMQKSIQAHIHSSREAAGKRQQVEGGGGCGCF